MIQSSSDCMKAKNKLEWNSGATRPRSSSSLFTCFNHEITDFNKESTQTTDLLLGFHHSLLTSFFEFFFLSCLCAIWPTVVFYLTSDSGPALVFNNLYCLLNWKVDLLKYDCSIFQRYMYYNIKATSSAEWALMCSAARGAHSVITGIYLLNRNFCISQHFFIYKNISSSSNIKHKRLNVRWRLIKKSTFCQRLVKMRINNEGTNRADGLLSSVGGVFVVCGTRRSPVDFSAESAVRSLWLLDYG